MFFLHSTIFIELLTYLEIMKQIKIAFQNETNGGNLKIKNFFFNSFRYAILMRFLPPPPPKKKIAFIFDSLYFICVV